MNANLIETRRQPQNDKERAKAKRIWAAYRWTWGMYWALGTKQGWECAICGRSATSSALNGELDGLNIDHRHFRVICHRVGLNGILDGHEQDAKWMAEVPEFPDTRVWGMTKKNVQEMARELALPKSVRGLLCPGRHGKAGQGCCNRLLGRVDNIEWLESSANYLKNPPAKSLQI